MICYMLPSSPRTWPKMNHKLIVQIDAQTLVFSKLILFSNYGKAQTLVKLYSIYLNKYNN